MTNIIFEALQTVESFQIPIRIPEICDVSVQLNEKGERTRIHNSHVYFGRNKININNILFHTLMFQIFDMKIDQIYKETIDSGFYSKYKIIPKNDPFLVSIRESYRIMYFIRNIIVHNQDKLKFSDSEIKSNYAKTNNKGKKNSYSISILRHHLEAIYGIVYLFSKYNMSSNEYNRSIICSMFSFAASGISVFHDEIYANSKEEIERIDPKFLLKWHRIYRQKEVDCQFDDGTKKVKLINAFDVAKSESGIYGCDYHISVLGKNYIVPSELFESCSHIPISDLSIWEINGPSSAPYYGIYRSSLE